MDNIGEKLTQLRLERMLSQSDVADSLGLKKATISGYERNTLKPSIDVLRKLSEFYAVSSDYLLGLKDRSQILLGDINPDEIATVLRIVDEIRLLRK